MENKKVWFVTGASKGLGLTLVKKLLSNGYNVAATSRNLNDLSKAVGEFEKFLPLSVDLMSIYCATKFAVAGFTESLAAEVKSLGIKATVIEPGYFRTEFLTSGSLAVPANPIDAYKEVRESQAAHQNDINNQQPGDPAKAIDVIIAAAESDDAPLHLFLGPDAYHVANAKIADVQKDMENWKALATATNFDNTEK
ncbi:MAG: SDR family NAD(P)-dependent oxidoreductase [Pedobacter sp.]|nr:MAG: SDR family NAD(P)-dependent oxidoreductase [Pedobacter sp.]